MEVKLTSPPRKNYPVSLGLTKQQALDDDPKAVKKKKNLTEGLDREKTKTRVFIFEEVKDSIFDLSQGTVSTTNLSYFNILTE